MKKMRNTGKGRAGRAAVVLALVAAGMVPGTGPAAAKHGPCDTGSASDDVYEDELGRAHCFDGGLGNDEAHMLDGDDEVYGDLGDDVLDGGEGDDLVEGGEGADQLFGLGGNDTLKGGGGDDSIDGGDGYDKCYGGLGEDAMVNCEEIHADLDGPPPSS